MAPSVTKNTNNKASTRRAIRALDVVTIPNSCGRTRPTGVDRIYDLSAPRAHHAVWKRYFECGDRSVMRLPRPMLVKMLEAAAEPVAFKDASNELRDNVRLYFHVTVDDNDIKS